MAQILSQPGVVTCDEYFHYLLRAFTEPAPALTDWRPDASFRYPLLFSLKYLLTKTAISENPSASLDEIIGAYQNSGFKGNESDEQFISLVGQSEDHQTAGQNTPDHLHRQAAESLRVIAQISYLHIQDNQIIVSLNPADAQDIFSDLLPVPGPCASEREAEIRRLAALFKEGSTDIFFDYPNTIINDVAESGFQEGGRVRKTHVTIERNARLRKGFFEANPGAICDVCTLNTRKTYPWTERILDIHHLLPLSSGTRVEARGTTFKDLVPVCPNCHRAIHRYYDQWLERNQRKDFKDKLEAQAVYEEMKTQFSGLIL